MKKLLFTTLLLLLVSCSREKLSDQSIIDNEYAQQTYTELDKWIESHFTLPYNITITYRWDKNNAPKGTYIYPPEVSKVKPVLEAIQYLWLELYQEEALGGKDFWKDRAPFTIYLYGGKNVDSTEQELLAAPSAVGREMHLYNVNEFDPKDRDKVYVLMRSLHHQFARLLGELFPYDRTAFLSISQRDYRSDFNYQLYGLPTDGVALYALRYYPRKRDLNNCTSALPFRYFQALTDCQQAHVQAGINTECYFCNFTQSSANQSGFLTYQAMISAESDFAEMISVPLTTPNSQIEIAKEIAKTPTGTTDAEVQRAALSYNNLLKKEAFITDYFNKNLGFSLRRLQLYSLQRLNRFSNQ